MVVQHHECQERILGSKKKVEMASMVLEVPAHSLEHHHQPPLGLTEKCSSCKMKDTQGKTKS